MSDEPRSLSDLADKEEIAAGIPITTKPRRDRSWDKKHQPQLRSYRDIPDDVHERIKEIAAEHNVSIGEVVRYFLEHAIHKYDSNDFFLETGAKRVGLTLYPEEIGGIGLSNSEPFFICKIPCKRPCKWHKNSGLHHVCVDACNGINDQR